MTKIYCPKCGTPAELDQEQLLVPYLCQKCGHDFVARDRDGATSPRPVFHLAPVGESRVHSPESSAPAASGFGIVLIVLGVLVFLFFAFIFDTSVTTADGVAVNNIGLLNDRLVGVIAGGLIVIVGAVVCTTATKRS